MSDFSLLDDSFWIATFFFFMQLYDYSLLSSQRCVFSIFLQRHKQNCAPTCSIVTFVDELSFLFTKIFLFSNKILINFYDIHSFSSPLGTRANPLPHHSTSSGCHSEVNTSLKYTSWFNLGVFLLSSVYKSCSLLISISIKKIEGW